MKAPVIDNSSFGPIEATQHKYQSNESIVEDHQLTASFPKPDDPTFIEHEPSSTVPLISTPTNRPKRMREALAVSTADKYKPNLNIQILPQQPEYGN